MLATNRSQQIGRHGLWQTWAALAALLLLTSGCAIPLPAPLTRTAAVPLNGAALTPPRMVPDITLLRSDGSVFHTADLKGRVSLVFFGYTFCPDVCPLTLAEVTQVRRLLGPDAQQVDVYFVTVDPARDTPERLHRYVKAFDPAIEGLTGGPADLEQMRVAFGAVAARRDAPDGGPNYFMDHTAGLFLVDRDGGISMLYAYGTPPEQIGDDLHRIVRR
jgi:protein SCO1/2